jgi:hypothetical protein
LKIFIFIFFFFFFSFRGNIFNSKMNLAKRYFPHAHNMDGFFVAKLRKISNKIPNSGMLENFSKKKKKIFFFFFNIFKKFRN